MSKTIETITISQTEITLTEVCQEYNISESTLLEMQEHGLFEIQNHQLTTIDVNAINKIASALRLQRDLGVNLQGAVLALELLDELESLRCELDFFRKYIQHSD